MFFYFKQNCIFESYCSIRMKKSILFFLIFLLTSIVGNAQADYKIKIHLKNCPDTLAYLTYYQFDKNLIKDTCTTIQNDTIVFEGKSKLPKGIYTLVSQQKSIYFDFFIDDATQHLEIETEYGANLVKNLKSNSKLQNHFFDYIRFIGQQGQELQAYQATINPKIRKDSLLLLDKQKELEYILLNVEKKFIETNQGSYIAEVVNLKTKRLLTSENTLSNQKKDSLAEFNYYKKHYWDGVNFKDDATIRNPFFNLKIKTYFDKIVYTHPDSVSVEIDRMIDQTIPGSLFHKILIGHFTYQYETSKIMGFDKVFIHMAEKYFKTGKANGIYNDATIVTKIIKRAEKLKPIAIGSTAPELYLIETKNIDKVNQLGFDKATTSEEVTNLYRKNKDEISNLFLKLSDVKADYTVLAFWDVDCGHCQKEIPKLLEAYHQLLKNGINLKVISVYTLFETDKYLKYIKEHQLDWINTYDGIHFNNVIEKYDVYSTPVFYLLDQNKTIKAKRFGVDQLQKIITTVTEEKNKSK